MESKLAENSKERSASLEDLALRNLVGKGVVPLPMLVADLSRELGLTKDRVAASLIELQSKKRIVISEGTPRRSLASYSMLPSSLWFWAAVASALVSLGLVFVTSGIFLYLRYAFGGILILFLPGFSLVELLYPKRELDDLTTLALSIGLSLALVPLVGLVLNYLPFGIRLIPVASSLSGLSMVFLVLALGRKHVNYKAANGLS